MKTRHFILAVLALLCSATLFTACGSDDDDKGKNPAEDIARTKVGLIFKLQVTEDMLKYCDIKVTLDDGDGSPLTGYVTKDNVTTDKNCLYFKAITKTKLPATIKVSRQISMKEGVDVTSDEVIRFSGTHGYYYSYYNAADEVLSNLNDGSNIDHFSPNTKPAKLSKFAETIATGFLDITYTLTFSKDGEMDIQY